MVDCSTLITSLSIFALAHRQPHPHGVNLPEMTREKQKITLKSIVADTLERWPEVIPVFIKYQMKCVGCSMAAFDSIAEALKNHGIPANQFLDDINNALIENERLPRMLRRKNHD
ncbi:MAG: hypothetical protein B6243_05550 [Anaerolineaceae bacterium 4572_5.2]|nr:MAG: hypothetical protein B6243_05550 [Anaerolineaceae bacterium 4572_5.2]